VGNDASGIPGSGIFICTGSGNKVVKNQVLGNLLSTDIFDLSAPGASSYDDNLCEVSGGPGAVNVCEIPDLAGHRNPDEDDK
jgi:hypothetical protein